MIYLKNNKDILITGCAGFIGNQFALKSLNKKFKVIGIDNYDNYYSIPLKKKIKFKKKKILNFIKLILETFKN